MSDFLDLQGAKDLNTDTIHMSAVANSVDPATGAPIDTHVNRAGGTDYTLDGLYKAIGPVVMPWTSVTGGTLTQPNQAFLHPANGNYYSWGGAFQHTVAPGTDPTLPSSGYVPRSDVVLRNELAAPSGVALVGGAATSDSVSALQRNDSRSMAVIAGQLIAGTSAGSKIHFFGDSTMWGSNPAPDTTVQQTTNPPAMFKIALDILYPSNGVTVANKAIAGSALYSLLRGINHHYPTTYEQMIAADTPT